MYILLFMIHVLFIYMFFISSGKLATTLCWLWIGLVGYNSFFIVNELANKEIMTPRDIHIAKKAMDNKIWDGVMEALLLLVSLLFIFFFFVNNKNNIIEHYKVFYLTLVIELLILRGVHMTIRFYKTI